MKWTILKQKLSQCLRRWKKYLSIVAAPIVEELILRGIILDGFLRMYSPVKSILYSSFLFGIFHLNPWQFVGAMVISVFSGRVYYRTGKLSLCIFIHFVNNFLVTVASYFMDPSETMNESLVESYGGSVPVVISILVAIIVLFTCIFLLSEKFDQIKINPWREPISDIEPVITVDDRLIE